MTDEWLGNRTSKMTGKTFVVTKVLIYARQSLQHE
jgi:hypothetical protein